MKLYKKKNLTLSDGLLVTKKNKIVCVDSNVVYQANKLETLKQQTDWINSKPKLYKEPNMDDFKREHCGHKVELHTSTPVLDKKIKESLQLVEEIDKKNDTEAAEHIINTMFDELLNFVNNKNVIGADGFCPKFDTPHLGDPLEWTNEDIVIVVANAVAAGVIQD